MTDKPSSIETITIAGGCFWCFEPIFDELQGVRDTVVGYSGGKLPSPSYALVCTGMTGHAEAIQVTFDPTILSLHDLLVVFFTMHDPTTPNRQGADVGTQYRSAIFYHTPQQKQVAEAVIGEITQAGIWPGAIVTELTALSHFYPAEDYHQDYFRKNPQQAYCRAVINPKITKFRKLFLQKHSN
jgi:peptide-methionine (S)-S-oxide reductase